MSARQKRHDKLTKVREEEAKAWRIEELARIRVEVEQRQQEEAAAFEREQYAQRAFARHQEEAAARARARGEMPKAEAKKLVGEFREEMQAAMKEADSATAVNKVLEKTLVVCTKTDSKGRTVPVFDLAKLLCMAAATN